MKKNLGILFAKAKSQIIEEIVKEVISQNSIISFNPPVIFPERDNNVWDVYISQLSWNDQDNTLYCEYSRCYFDGGTNTYSHPITNFTLDELFSIAERL